MYTKPLTQSSVGEAIWKLAGEDLDEFKEQVRLYFSKALPGFTPVKINYERKIIWLRDDR